MAAVLGTNPFRLTPVAEGRGVSCDVRGCYVGKEPLLTRSRDTSGRELWAARPQSELEEALSASYGHPIDMSAKVDGLAAIADALNRGDVFRAQLGTLALKLPHPPAPAFAKRFVSRARLAASLDRHAEGWARLSAPDNSGQRLLRQRTTRGARILSRRIRVSFRHRNSSSRKFRWRFHGQDRRRRSNHGISFDRGPGRFRQICPDPGKHPWTKMLLPINLGLRPAPYRPTGFSRSLVRSPAFGRANWSILILKGGNAPRNGPKLIRCATTNF